LTGLCSGGSRISKWEGPRLNAVGTKIEAPRGIGCGEGVCPVERFGEVPPQKKFFEFKSKIFDLWCIIQEVVNFCICCEF